MDADKDFDPTWLDDEVNAAHAKEQQRRDSETKRSKAPGPRTKPESDPRPERQGSIQASEAHDDLTDDGLALRFTETYGDSLRHVDRWSQWMRWDGTRWKADETRYVFDSARKVCREVAKEGQLKPAERARILDGSTIASVERLARSDRVHAATADQWDADPFLLATPGGVVDLRTGEVRRASRDDYCTRLTATAPSNTGCPLWRAFLDRVTAHDPELQGYLQRMAGYALTGSVREQIFFFAYGGGGNGKGVFVNTLRGIAKEYGVVTHAEMLMQTRGERHPTELASLRGARLATAQEVGEGCAWNEARIKSLTGGDPITARFMRGDFFEFAPQFKLLIAGNNKPHLRSVDEAIRRRIRLLPFEVTIPEEQRDQTLADKLRAEWPGILHWVIEGAVAWYSDGLRTPDRVLNATQDYLDAEDSLGEWLAVNCESRKGVSELARDLFSSWSTFCRDRNEESGKQRSFSDKLEARGFVRRHSRGGKVHCDIKLKQDTANAYRTELHVA